MFTGIVEAVGLVKSIEKTATSGKITIAAKFASVGIEVGGSVAVDGACLTVSLLGDGHFTADISPESMSKTTLSMLNAGDSVNLELPLTLSKPMGGHMVSGHVDCVGDVSGRVATGGGGVELTVSIPEQFRRLLVAKGSVAVSGVSLTVARLSTGGFVSAVIPHTLKSTTLGELKKGAKLNIETDLIGKYVENFLKPYKEQGITEEFLKEHGF